MARTKDFDEGKVLNKAICLFWHKGYNGTSMQELVDELGISRSSLYDTFGDKRDLYIKALEHYQKDAGSNMCKVISNAPTSKEAVRQLLELIIDEMLGDKQKKGCFLVNAGVETAPHDPGVMKIIVQNEDLIEESFYKAINKGVKSGEFKHKQDARALARFIANTVKGIQVTAKSTNDKKVFKDIVDVAMGVFD